MRLDIQALGIKEVSKSLEDLARKQVPFASMVAINRVASDVLKENRELMKLGFNSPTPYTLRAAIDKVATKSKPYADVFLREDAPSKGTPWADVVAHHYTGGARPYRKIEKAFYRIGLLPRGYVIVPGAAAPKDGYGNVPASFQRMLISYFGAFAEVGYRANMKDKRKGKIADRGVSARGFKTINGAEYFVSRGRGEWYGRRSWTHGRSQYLPMGIWSKSGIHGSDVKPVLMFVKAGTYRKRLDLLQVGQKVIDERFSAHFDAALRMAMRSAK